MKMTTMMMIYKVFIPAKSKDDYLKRTEWQSMHEYSMLNHELNYTVLLGFFFSWRYNPHRELYFTAL